jgi:para-aminobenzoate synthetase/4-amino-4-deoxychorismate lyase
VLRLVRGDAHPVALFGDWAGGADVVASEPLLVRATTGSVEDAFDAPDPVVGDLAGVAGAPGTGAFGGGWIGYLGFSGGGEALRATGARRLPACWFGYYDHVLRRDAETGEWVFEALWTAQRAEALTSRLAELERRAAAAPAELAGFGFGAFLLTPGAAGHQAAVAKTVDYIRAGDIFQANICLRAEAEFTGDPLDAFCQAAAALQPPYAAFIGISAAPAPSAARFGTADAAAAGRAADSPGLTRAAVASLSPELFLRRTGDTVVSKPIKGTARRPAGEAEAAAQLAELESSVKNRAENVMIVDLVRNDLSRVCVPGSVTVPVLLGAEPHPGVWHLVSTVQGILEPSRSDGDLIRATFPPGSVTGAPKVRALEVIDELETAPREAYTGAIGFRSPLAGLELNVAIRTFEFAPATARRPGRAWLGAGGGIVADSDPAAEYAECLIKATPLVTALGAILDTQAPGLASTAAAAQLGVDRDRQAGGPSAATLDGFLARGLDGLRPHPTAGVFTSLKVTASQTRDLAAHLTRLAASVRDLYGKDLPVSLHTDLAATLADAPTGRLRITVRPVGGPLQATVEVVPLPPTPSRTRAGTNSGITARSGAAAPASPAPVTLHPAVVPGGIGAHKYRDRRLIDELTRLAGVLAGEHALLIDETGELLETDRANVFAVIDGVLLTPPADGRLLPGVARAATLRAARGRGIKTGQKPLTLGELAEATEVFVTNSVAGLVPVRAIDGLPLCWVRGPVAARLSAALATNPADEPLPQARQPAKDAFRATANRRRPVVILVDNYDSFTFNLAHLIEVSGCHVEVVRNDEVTAAEISAAHPDGVVISPGPCAPAEAGISIDVVRACVTTGTPLLGICLGHQSIGAAFGADIIRAPRPVHGTAYRVAHDGSGVLAGLPDPFQATRYHSLIVDERTLPGELLVTARTDALPMALRHRTLPIEGVQFHPESILTPDGAQLIRNFTARCTGGSEPRR